MLVQKGPLQNFDVNALEAALVKRDRRRLRLAFGGAVLLHASTALSLTFWTPAEPVSPPGEMVITVDLAPAVMSTATTESAGEASESAPQEMTPPEEQPDKPEELTEEQPLPEPEITKEEIAEPPPPSEKAEVTIAPKKKEIKTKPKPKVATAAQAASAANEKRADVGGTGAHATPSDLADYIGRLRAALERRKRYPAAAGGVSGTASLRFTVNRAGQVTGFTLVRSSGHAALDSATRAMI